MIDDVSHDVVGTLINITANLAPVPGRVHRSHMIRVFSEILCDQLARRASLVNPFVAIERMVLFESSSTEAKELHFFFQRQGIVLRLRLRNCIARI